jgi:hypothetical protein
MLLPRWTPAPALVYVPSPAVAPVAVAVAVTVVVAVPESSPSNKVNKEFQACSPCEFIGMECACWEVTGMCKLDEEKGVTFRFATKSNDSSEDKFRWMLILIAFAFEFPLVFALIEVVVKCWYEWSVVASVARIVFDNNVLASLFLTFVLLSLSWSRV